MAQDAELERLRRDNESLRHAVSLLHRVAILVREALELEATCYAILTGVTAGVGLGLNRAMLFLVDPDDRGSLRGAGAVGPRDRAEADRIWRSIEDGEHDLQTLYRGLRQQHDPSPLDRQVRQVGVAIDGDSPVARALRNREVVRGEGSDDLAGLLDLPTCIATPLRGKGRVVGVLYGDNRFTGKRLDPHAQLVFSLLGDYAGRAIDGARAYDRVAEAARTDALTGLGHHGAMRAALAEALETEASSHDPLALAMIDLDDFKQINDELGHLVGDALLAAVADRLRGALRSGARAYRYGGEEFAVLLPGAAEDELGRIGERIRSALGAHPYSVGIPEPIAVTCSIGLALTRGGGDAQALIGAADEALLRAKRAGKNRVEIA